MATFQELSEAIQKGNATAAKEMTSSMLAEKKSPEDILTKGLLDGMEKIGRRFKVNEVYIPEVLIAARAMNQSMEIKARARESRSQADRKNAFRNCQGGPP